MTFILVGRAVQIKKKLQKESGNPRFQKGYTTHVPYEGPKNIGGTVQGFVATSAGFVCDKCLGLQIAMIPVNSTCAFTS